MFVYVYPCPDGDPYGYEDLRMASRWEIGSRGGGVGEKGLVEEEDDKRLALVCKKQGGGGRGTDTYCLDLGCVRVV